MLRVCLVYWSKVLVTPCMPRPLPCVQVKAGVPQGHSTILANWRGSQLDRRGVQTGRATAGMSGWLRVAYQACLLLSPHLCFVSRLLLEGLVKEVLWWASGI